MPDELGDKEALAEIDALRREVARLRRLVGAASGFELIGREGTLDEIDAALRGKGAVTTLVGPPGVGKTAVARAVAQRRQARSAFCAIGGAVDEGALAAVVAASLSLAPGPFEEQIGVALRARGAFLLVLDGIEEPGPLDAVMGWLRAAPRTRVLVTSRRAVGLREEHVIELDGLELPRRDDDVDCAAARLFLARAETAGSKLELSPDAARDVVRIVRGLDGIPLAIELAASRITHESLHRVAATVDAPALVEDGSSGIDRAVAASWKLLGPLERGSLERASLFRGGFDLDAASYVLELSPPHALASLQRLVDCSLLSVEQQPEGGARYKLLETIRRFASAELERDAGRAGAVGDRHAAYYLTEIDRRLRPKETANLAAVLGRALGRRNATGAPRAALELAAAGDVARFLRDVPTLLEWEEVRPEVAFELALTASKCADKMQRPDAAARFLTRARSLADALGADAAARCDLLDARLRLHHGDLEEVRAAIARARARGASSLDLDLEAQVLSASADLFEGQLGAAETGFERALRLAREHDRPGVEARSLNGLTAAHHLQGAFTESLDDARAAAEAAARTGDPVAEGRARGDAGLLAAEHGDLLTARAELERAQQQLERYGDLRHAATAAQNLAAVYRELGDLDRALRAALAAQRAGGRRLVGFAFAERGYIAHELGDHRRAKSFYERALEAHRTAGNRFFAARMLPFRAATLLELGDPDGAAQAFAEADRAFEEVGDRMGGAIASTLRGNQPPTSTGTSPELRFARRLRERALEQLTSGGVRVRVAADGEWFETGQTRTSLKTRHALKLLLTRLVTAHASSALSSVDELFRAGWPGDRASERSAARRVYVAVATLRKLGLRDQIERHSQGYRLIGDVVIEGI